MTSLILKRPEQVLIGVTGHRSLQHPAQIGEMIDRVIDHIQQICPGCSLTLFSPLAEGADRLVAKRLLARDGARLIAIMPMRIADYMSDFETTASKDEFNQLLQRASEVIDLAEQSNREQSYLAAGRYILDRSDLLIALWDGRPSKGVGGTAEIVAQARERGMPLAWIRVARSKADERRADSSGSSPDLCYENFP
jgi:hypothetical protein